MPNKQNPILAAFEAKKEAEFIGRLARNTEINMIATLIAGSDLGFLGEKRAGLLLERQLKVKLEIAEVLVRDAEDDPSLAYTKHTLAERIKSILGEEGWARCQQLFPLLYDYWVPGGDTHEKV